MKLNLLVHLFSFFFLFYQTFTVEAQKTGIKLRRENLQGEGYSLQRIEPPLCEILSRFTLLTQKTLSSVQPVNKKEERFYSDAFSKLLEDVQRLFTILGIIVGAVWTYYNFFQGRTFSHRLELKVNGRIIPKDNLQYLLVEYSLKNIGLTKIEIKETSSLQISSHNSKSIPSRIKFNRVAWELLSTTQNGIFLYPLWIESNEIVYGQSLYIISKENKFPFEAELRIVSKTSFLFKFSKENTWDCRSIIGLDTKSYTSTIENEQEIKP